MKKLIASIPFFAVSICGFASIKSIDTDTLRSQDKKQNSAGNTGNSLALSPKSLPSGFRNLRLPVPKINTDTLSAVESGTINSISDTSLVLSEDIPMPVDENSMFENALYHKRLDSLQKEIPLSYNEYVQSYINLYAYKRRKLVERLLGEGTYYFPVFEKALKEAGVPTQLEYLSIIESELNPFAISRVGATGLWQFMFGTGRDYGLHINSFIDERRDPVKASHAAATYFRDSYAIYGDWLLVIASYNCGTGNVNRAIRRAGGGQKTFWEIQRYLPRETRSYVPAFIAATYIFSYARQHGLHPEKPVFSVTNDSVMVTSKLSLNDIAASLSINPSEMRRLNPQYKRGIINASVDEPMGVVLPVEKKAEFVAVRDNLQVMPGNLNVYQVGYARHDRENSRHILVHFKVRIGETLAKIADRYEVTVQDLKVWNHLHHFEIVPGQRLKVQKVVYGSAASSRNIARAQSHSRHNHYRHLAGHSRYHHHHNHSVA